MVGDQNDMLARLRAVLPSRWFPDSTPVLAGLLSGLAQSAAWVFGLIGYTRQQTRIATATAPWLDLVAQDCFGARLVRQAGESDAGLRARIFQELLRPRATRAALVKQVVDLTGNAPWVFEPMRPADTGCWNTALAYNAVGGWGSLLMPFQALVVAQPANGGGVPGVSGYGGAAGGYGRGQLEYAPSSAAGNGADAAILAAIASVMPACGIAWTRIAP